MKNKLTVRLVRYGISFLIGLCISVLVALHQGYTLAQPSYLQARYWSDGFFVAGILLTGLGGMLAISSTGFFDMFSYALYCLLMRFTQMKRNRDRKDFFIYKTNKDSHRGKPMWFLLIIGLGFCLLSVTCWVWYSSFA